MLESYSSSRLPLYAAPYQRRCPGQPIHDAGSVCRLRASKMARLLSCSPYRRHATDFKTGGRPEQTPKTEGTATDCEAGEEALPWIRTARRALHAVSNSHPTDGAVPAQRGALSERDPDWHKRAGWAPRAGRPAALGVVALT
ncbi:hypothetical protein HPB51_015376 [Rhipicephalus microplus]|uniref:Uncharacterized protein n=1 Tax=Rhipicephalus microplus TaxID=6941 RepID=A0A9J6DV09_RHIMP|nr:hypothetical protein HPB51_015376 [Rhipicephalus microplus]